jgi:hypothetical protein
VFLSVKAQGELGAATGNAAGAASATPRGCGPAPSSERAPRV